MSWPANVERWRPIVERHFPPALVDKALHVINFESGGDPNLRGDNGVAIGLFQIHDVTSIPGRPTAEWLLVPENNIQFAAETLGAAAGRWTDWGEGVLFKGKKFGALGNHPYTGEGQAGGGGGATVRAASTERAAAPTYTVKSGEVLSAIGAALNVDWREIARENNLSDPFVLFPGQVLRIPRAQGSGTVPPVTEPQAAGSLPKTYTVEPGDVLSVIGQKLGVDWREIARLNGIVDPFPLVPGQVLKLPGPPPAPTPPVTSNTARG